MRKNASNNSGAGAGVRHLHHACWHGISDKLQHFIVVIVLLSCSMNISRQSFFASAFSPIPPLSLGSDCSFNYRHLYTLVRSNIVQSSSSSSPPQPPPNSPLILQSLSSTRSAATALREATTAEPSSSTRLSSSSTLELAPLSPPLSSQQSQLQSPSPLTIEQEELLSSLDVDTYGGAFLGKVRELLEYKNVHGTCSVPKRYKQNPALGNWVNKTRQMYRKYREGKSSSMTPERIDVLNDIGFIWSGTLVNYANDYNNNMVRSNDRVVIDKGGDNFHHDRMQKQQQQYQHFQQQQYQTYQTIQDQLWMKQYNTLRDFWIGNNKSYSSLRSPQHTKFKKLGSWIVRQRREYQNFKRGEKSTMNKERFDLLEEIDFDWSPRNTRWNKRIRELVEYKIEHGDCMVPVQYKENPRLGRWVSTQRKYYKMYKNGNKSRITKEKIKQLSDIGFVWSRWEHTWSDRGI